MSIREKLKKIDSENKWFQGCILIFVTIFFIFPILQIFINNYGFGYIGLFLLLIAYICLLFKKLKRWFYPINFFASFILTIYAIILNNIPFMVTNGFITLILLIKLFKKEII